jgi:hypothetical protein
MPTFTDQDKAILDILRKAYEKSAYTEASRDPWQELFTRETSHYAAKSVLAASMVKGFTGSWAASFNFGYGASDIFLFDSFTETNQDLNGATPTPIREVTTKLGQRGVPDIDFVPYNWRTNRFGSKGPSLIGHPISFEVVGPTLKSPACDWIWDFVPGGGPNGGDLLTMAERYDGGVPTCTTIATAYNLPTFTIGNSSEPNGGLYVVISDVGADPGSMPPGKGEEIQDRYIETLPYELFRVASVGVNFIELHPSKPLAPFLTSPFPTPAIRAITLLQPFVTKLVAVPNSGAGKGREQTFIVVTPERAAQSDLYPPYDGGTPGDGTWLQGGFTGSTVVAGSPSAYGGRNILPVPVPRDERNGELDRDLVPTYLPVGRFRMQNTAAFASDVGDIVNVYDIANGNRSPTTFSSDSVLGWFQIVDQPSPFYLELQRTVEVDPTSGNTYFGPGPLLTVADNAQSFLSYTVHDPVSVLWEGNFKADYVDSCRLTNLIDPRYVERLEKTISQPSAGGDPQYAPPGANGGRSDRAIFNTATLPNLSGIRYADNPGSLLDLGFRMVLFPAKDGGGFPIPDFDRPIYSREAIIDGGLDPSIKQYIDIDYSAGIVRLSVPPPILGRGGLPSVATDIIPNGIIGPAQNERGEVILYAACVPFSMEPGQIGTGTRVTGKKIGSTHDVDVLSDEIAAYVNTVATPITPGLPGFTNIVLDRKWDGPKTGVVEIRAGSSDTVSYGIWQYNDVQDTTIVPFGGVEFTFSTLIGVQARPSNSPPSVPLSPNSSYYVVLRRQAATGQLALDPGELFEIGQIDTSYGASARPSAMRFNGADVEYLLDGSVEITPQVDPQRWQAWGTVHPSLRTRVYNDGGVPNHVSTFVRPDGLFSDAAFFNELGQVTIPGPLLTVPTDYFQQTLDTCGIQSDPEGQYLQFSLANPGNVRAMAFFKPLVRTSHKFRFVSKFSFIANDPLGDFVMYQGFLNPGIFTNIANVALANPGLFATNPFLGLRFQGDPQDLTTPWEIIISDGAGFVLQEPTVRLNPLLSHYLVIETEADGFGSPLPNRIKFAIFDVNLRLQYKRVFKPGEFTLPSNLDMYPFFGIRGIVVPARTEFNSFYMTYVTRKGEPGPRF